LGIETGPPPATPKDQPAATPDAAAVAAPAPAAATPAPAPATEPKVETPAPPKLRRLDDPSAPVDSKSWHRTLRTHHHSTGNEVVHVGGDAVLEKGQTADAVVAVFGSATSDGEVSDSVVSIFGNTKVNGPVGDSAVAVGGNVKVNSKVADAVEYQQKAVAACEDDSTKSELEATLKKYKDAADKAGDKAK